MSNGLRGIALGAAAAFILAGGAHATSVLSDTFDGENGGASALNYTGFANWTVPLGTVDLVKSGDFGIACHGGAGSCVDLQGSELSDVDRIESGGLFGFDAGDVVTVSFWLSGNQRGGDDDFWSTTLRFTTPQDIQADVGGAFTPPDVGPFPNVTLLSTAQVAHPADPFQFYRTTFTSTTAGAFHLLFETPAQDLAGPILDDVTVDVSAAGSGAPEPAAWALMLGGFAAAGAALRRRRDVICGRPSPVSSRIAPATAAQEA